VEEGIVIGSGEKAQSSREAEDKGSTEALSQKAGDRRGGGARPANKSRRRKMIKK